MTPPAARMGFFAWVARTLRPVPRMFVMAVKASLAGQTSDPRAVLVPPKYHVETWPDFGRMPVAHADSWSEWLTVGAFKVFYRIALMLPVNRDGIPNVEKQAAAIDKMLTPALAKFVSPIDPADLGPDQLYQLVIVQGFAHLKRREDGLHELDLTFLEQYQPHHTSYPIGGKVVISQTAKRVEWLETPNDKRVCKPGDATYDVDSFLFRSTLFQWMTAVPHSVWCHGIVGPKLFLAVYDAPEDHSIRSLFAPFVFEVHKNVARAAFTVFGSTGVLERAGGFSSGAIAKLLKDGIGMFEVKLPTEMNLPVELRDTLLSIWDAVVTMCRDGIAALQLAPDDPQLKHFHDVLAKELHPRLGELPVAEAAAFCIFTSAVSHQCVLCRRAPRRRHRPRLTTTRDEACGGTSTSDRATRGTSRRGRAGRASAARATSSSRT